MTNSERESLTPLVEDSQRRRVVLITHANPQDNTIARWLAARLSTAGYKVWVDLRSLTGGNDFWSIIEDQLRHNAIKQIVLVSPHIRKPGVLKELALGDYVGKQLDDPDFMIPVRIADVPHGEFPPELLRRNSFDAFPNWAAVLSPLLETLENAGVEKTEASAGRLLSEFIDAQEVGRLSIQDQPEALLTNWFPLMPECPKMRFFKVEGTTEQISHWIGSTRIPYIEHSGLIGTFCDLNALVHTGHNPPRIRERFRIPFSHIADRGEIDPFPNRQEARRFAVNLLRQYWDRAMERSGLVPMEFASGNRGWFFPDGLIDGSVKFTTSDGRQINRLVSGKFKERRWHLCLIGQPRFWPHPQFRIHANVALTEDGKTPLPGDQTHKLRLRLTRSWWNDKWRDLLLAGVGWLAGYDEFLDLSVEGERLQLSSLPYSVEFPFSYDAEESRDAEENELGDVELAPDLDTFFPDDFASDPPEETA